MPDASVNVPGATSHDAGTLSGKDFGAAWPLTVPWVIIQCHDIIRAGMHLNLLTLQAPEGAIYSANGMGYSHTGYPIFEPIWAEDLDFPGRKKDPGPVMDAARALCNH